MHYVENFHFVFSHRQVPVRGPSLAGWGRAGNWDWKPGVRSWTGDLLKCPAPAAPRLLPGSSQLLATQHNNLYTLHKSLKFMIIMLRDRILRKLELSEFWFIKPSSHLSIKIWNIIFWIRGSKRDNLRNVMDKTNEFLSIKWDFGRLSEYSTDKFWCSMMQPNILQSTSDWLSAESVLQPAQPEQVKQKLGRKLQ